MLRLSLVFSVFLLISCNSGGGSKRMTTDHDPCREDNKELKALNSDQIWEFYQVLAPVSDIDRAFDIAPKEDNQKIKLPEIQGKMVKDIRDRCIVQSANVDSEYDYQTFKNQKSVKTGKAPDIHCPVDMDQKLELDKTMPAFSSDKITKEVRSHLQFTWRKLIPEYKELGPVNSVQMSGDAKIHWLKSNVNQVNVKENYDMKLDVASKGQVDGTYRVCKMFYTIEKAKYETTVTRIAVTMNNVPMEGKFLTVTKYIQKSDKIWELDRVRRSDFYLNNVYFKPDEIAGLEKRRADTIKTP